MIKYTLILSAFYAITMVASATAAEDTPAGVIEKSAIRYTDIDSAKGLLDLYLPTGKSEKLRPGVLLIHGGGWQAGNREQWRKLALLLAKRGYVCASASYRLAPTTDAFGMIADVRTAMDWLKGHAGEFGMDPERVGAVGSSAGGHLVALLATIPPYDQLGNPNQSIKFDTRPAAVVCYNPVLDFIDEDRIKKDYGERITRRKGEDAIADYKLLSPARRIIASMSPILFIYGDKDTLTPVDNSAKMIAGMNALGVATELEMFKDMEHGFGYSLAEGESHRAAEVAADYFDRMLKNN